MTTKSTIDGQEPVIMSENLFPVVGIGASAGGLDAFKKIVKSIPEDSGMAYVLVQHLDPTQESLLPELLQKVTEIPVTEISDEIKVQPNTIYIIPSNKILIANDGVLKLSPRPPKGLNTKNMPIDIFFSSLAEIHEAHAIGVVLSGTATDGTLGLKAIKEHGGITIAQDEDSAQFDGMPLSAINSGAVDFVLPPEEIIGRLMELKPQITLSDIELMNVPKQEEDIYKQTLTILRMRKGTDFSFYKQATIRRRILRRIALTNHPNSAEYLKFLRNNPAEQDLLYQNLLIPVTEFFRDHKIFDNLCNTVFPEIIKNKPPNKPIRIWLAGCSTGQEAYSVAICIKEYLGTSNQKVQIFATDISEPAIAKARSGIYSKSEVSGLSPYRLSENFIPLGDAYQVNKDLRNMCIFAVHNFLKDPPFGNMDFVACRNVLIYMEPYLQKKALTTFHYALNQKGMLLLGKSESITAVPELFSIAIQHDKLFSRKNVPARFMHVATAHNERRLDEANVPPERESIAMDFKKAADDIMLTKFTPSGVVVNDAMDIVQFRGNTTPYLEQTSGKPSHNLMKLAKPELAFELRNLLLKVKKENKPVIKENIHIDSGAQRLVTIEALQLPNLVDPHFLIIFRESMVELSAGRMSMPTEGSSTEGNYSESRIKQLETELAQIRDDMRTVTEDQEAANEELQSANEELLSGSEELQSLNEELETGKEELQSTNEELTVMNQEMVNLNEQLTHAIDYTETIIATIHEPLVVLHANMHVRSANKAFYSMFGLHPKDVEGVSIFDIGNQEWNVPSLQSLFRDILPARKNLVNHEVTIYVPGKGDRIMLLNAKEMNPVKSDEMLIMMVLEDITEKVMLQQKETELLRRFKNMLMHAPVAVCILNVQDYGIELANDFYFRSMAQDQSAIGMPIFKALPELDNQSTREILDNVVQTGINYYGNEIELQIIRNNENQKSYFDFVYQPLYESDKTISGIIIVANDVTEKVVARKKMELQAAMIYNLLMTAPGFVSTMEGPTHIFNLVNDRYQQLFGKREIKGKPLLEALPELEGQGINELLDKIYETGETYVGIDIPITLARDVDLEPELRYFNFSYQPMFDEDGKIHSILVFGYEVTEEVTAKNNVIAIQKEHSKELEEKIEQRTMELSIANKELIENNLKLQKLNKELESFNYISSHDLQEPLRKIQMFTGRILESKDSSNMSASTKDHFLRIQSSAWRMQTLIQDLLSYAHVSIADRKFKKVDLKSVIEDVVNDLSENIVAANAEIKFETTCEVNIDPSQFRQVLNNLIGNSLKYVLPDTKPRIEITCVEATGAEFNVEGLQRDKKYSKISVIDNGIGIDQKYHERIFDVFQRLHNMDNFAGTGIGLAIVKKIIDNHNGIIRVVSQIDKGATFELYIPEY